MNLNQVDMALTVIFVYLCLMVAQIVLNILFYIKIRRLEKNKPDFLQGPQGAMGTRGPKGERGEPGYSPTPDYIKELIRQVNNEHS